MPLGSSVEYTIHLTKNFDFRIRKEHQKNPMSTALMSQ